MIWQVHIPSPGMSARYTCSVLQADSLLQLSDILTPHVDLPTILLSDGWSVSIVWNEDG